MTMRMLIAESARLFPNVAQFDQKLWRRLSELGFVGRKRPGRSYDELDPREIGAFLLARLAADYLDEAVAVTSAIADLPGTIRGAPGHWTETAALPSDCTLRDALAALVTDFTAGRADNDRGLGYCEIRLTMPLPTVQVGLASAWWHSNKIHPSWDTFKGRFARSPAYEEGGDYLNDRAAIEAVQPKSLRMTSITTERSVDLATVRAFARAFAK